ncbi:MAG: DUF4143 domain-containing protein, partial [Syntrophomonadaceae bacterium]|nr:DUF4143 domain-containing protein [Syntrophomonadaceae bacterium]
MLAKIVLKSQKITQVIEPISVYSDLSSFKLYTGDVGLLTMRSEVPWQSVQAGEGHALVGAITENYVAQQLASKDYPLC